MMRKQMATYTITDRRESDWNPECAFKYRHRSSAGHPVAQAEVDRWLRDGREVFLWRWENHTPELIGHWTPNNSMHRMALRAAADAER